MNLIAFLAEVLLTFWKKKENYKDKAREWKTENLLDRIAEGSLNKTIKYTLLNEYKDTKINMAPVHG